MDASVMELRLEQWKPIFEAQAKSGLNKQEWCQQNGIRRWEFFILQTIDTIEVDLEDTDVDVLGTAYVSLIGLFAQTAGKKGGEFYTPTNMSKLVARLATVGLKKVLNVADCACGSGSLLLQVGEYVEVAKYYGQELTSSTYNLARMNMILHGIDYKNFHIINVDTLEDDSTFADERYSIQVANPPLSLNYITV